MDGAKDGKREGTEREDGKREGRETEGRMIRGKEGRKKIGW